MNEVLLRKEIEKFSDIFCSNDFADSDYSIMQKEPADFETIKQWIEQISIPTILKCFTYCIWTDKIAEGYFERKIDDGTLEMLLLRLENILHSGDIEPSDYIGGLKVVNTEHGMIINP